MNSTIIGFLQSVFKDSEIEDIKDSLQKAILNTLEKKGIRYRNAYIKKAAYHDMIDKKRHEKIIEMVSFDDINEKGLSYDPSELIDIQLDVSKVLQRNFNRIEQQIIVEYFSEGVGSHEIARKYSEKSQSTWYRWLEEKVRLLLREKLGVYHNVL